MPAWQGRLSEEKIAAVISYIFTISREDSASKTEPAAASQPVVASDMPGKALFFDLTRDRNCGVCHRVSDAGSEIAPQFKGLSQISPQSLLHQIKSQPVSENNIQVRLQDGEEFCGVRAGEDHNSLRVYDLGGAGPPVLRTIEKTSISSSKPCPSLNVHADNSRIYSASELVSIVEFLR
jgi:mono/diheme cytochrome c family protein